MNPSNELIAASSRLIRMNIHYRLDNRKYGAAAYAAWQAGCSILQALGYGASIPDVENSIDNLIDGYLLNNQVTISDLRLVGHDFDAMAQFVAEGLSLVHQPDPITTPQKENPVIFETPGIQVTDGDGNHTPEQSNMVNHPKHYNTHPKGIECIDVVEDAPFNIGNAMKYLWRVAWGGKFNDDEDLEKAEWYVHREREIREIRRNARQARIAQEMTDAVE